MRLYSTYVCVSRVHTHSDVTEVVSKGYSSSSRDKNTSAEGGYTGERAVCMYV